MASTLEAQRSARLIALKIGIPILCVLLAILGITRFRLSHSSLKKRAILLLEQKFDGTVEMQSFDVRIYPKIRAHGSGVVVRYEGRTDVPPLIVMQDFTAEATIAGLLKKPWDIDAVRLTGLVISVPPRGESRGQSMQVNRKQKEIPILIHELIADDAELQMLPKLAGKDPHIFLIHHLDMHYVGLHRAASFVAQLSNPKPPGEIDTSGNFGPWNPAEPAQTPLGANYTFSDADLGVFKGVSGILSSRGKFEGVLDHIDVEGETDTPDFAVSSGGHPIALHTTFSATVDGMNGDTFLHPVRAHFLHSFLTANGAVVQTPGKKGRAIVLDVKVEKGRLEDMLRLGVKSDTPLMIGPVTFSTRFDLPSGPGDVVDRLKLDGEFAVHGAEFTSAEVKQKLEALSRRAEGKPKDKKAGSSIATLQDHFSLNNRVFTLRQAKFSIPGASFAFDGTYALENEALDFHGIVRMDARLSQTVTGFKSFLLKPVDPFFRKDHATQIPIKISGTRIKPLVAPDFHRKDHPEEALK